MDVFHNSIFASTQIYPRNDCRKMYNNKVRYFRGRVPNFSLSLKLQYLAVELFTISSDKCPLREMVVGHVRQELDWDDCDDLEDCDNDVISLTMFQPSVRRDQVI